MNYKSLYISIITFLFSTLFINYTFGGITYSKALHELEHGDQNKSAYMFLEYYDKYKNKNDKYAPWALYHYILLTNSVDEARKLTQILRKKYPDFNRTDELYDYNAKISFLRKEYTISTKYYKILYHDKSFKNSKYRVNALYYLGKIYLNQGKIEDARTNFELMEKMYPSHDLVKQSKFNIAETYLFENNSSSMKKALYKYLKLAKDTSHPEYSAILYRIGVCYYSLNNKKMALVYWKRLYEKMPYSLESEFIKNRIKSSSNIKTISYTKTNSLQTDKTGKYYLQIGIYSNKKYAEITQKTFKKYNINCDIRLIDRNNKSYYQLYIGFYKTMKESIKIQKFLKGMGFESVIKEL